MLTTYISRRVELPPELAGPALDAWTERSRGRRASAGDPAPHLVLLAGTLQAPATPGSWLLRSVAAEARSGRGRLIGRVAVDLSVWSDRASEVGLRLLWPTTPPGEAYFRLAHAAADELVAELGPAPRRPDVPCRAAGCGRTRAADRCRTAGRSRTSLRLALRDDHPGPVTRQLLVVR